MDKAVIVECLILFLIVAPAVWMALNRSSWLIDYAIFVLAFNRGLRRIVDYYVNEEFNPRSPISLSPLLVAMLLFIPVLQNTDRITPQLRKIFGLFSVAIAGGFAVGFLLNKFAAVYSLAEWLSGLAALAFAATQRASSSEANRWIKSAGWAALGVAAYGWWQYYTIPAWDAMWLEQSGMQGYMGQPIPTQMTLFSTMNERGPCGTFLAWAAIPMILSRQWRNPLGWIAIVFVIATIFLTGTRSNFIVMAVVAVLYPALSRGRGAFRMLVLAALSVLVISFGASRIPGAERFAARYTAEEIHGEGSSLQGRLEIYRMGLSTIARNPLGLGLGSSGMGKRVEGGEGVVGDSGYVQIFAQFGWLGGIAFFAAFTLMWKELTRRSRNAVNAFRGPVDPFIPATRALLLATMVFLLVGDIFSGFSLIWVFFGRALAVSTDPALEPGRSPPTGGRRVVAIQRKVMRGPLAQGRS